MKEIFKDIEGYEDYQISNFGRVKTKTRKVRYTHAVTKKEHYRTTEERFLKVYLNNRTGYKFVQLYSNKKSKNKNIHRLVSIAFINNPENLPCVNHIDGNKHNNCVENLEWCTNEYNHEHATKTGLKAKGSDIKTSKLTTKDVTSIKILLNENIKPNIIAKAFNISRATICLIKYNKIWKHVIIN